MGLISREPGSFVSTPPCKLGHSIRGAPQWRQSSAGVPHVRDNPHILGSGEEGTLTSLGVVT